MISALPSVIAAPTRVHLRSSGTTQISHCCLGGRSSQRGLLTTPADVAINYKTDFRVSPNRQEVVIRSPSSSGRNVTSRRPREGTAWRADFQTPQPA